MATYIRRVISHLIDNQQNLTVAGSIIGANVGVFLFNEEDPSVPTVAKYIAGVLIGGGAGAVVGYCSPIIVPGLFLGTPGFVASKLHSSLQESRKKVETQVAPQHFENRKKEEKHELQLR